MRVRGAGGRLKRLMTSVRSINHISTHALQPTHTRTLDMSTTTSGSSAGPAALSLNLDNITLQRVTSEAGALGAPVKAGSLWAPNGAVVFVVRRPGCVLCREEAMDLSTKLLPQIKADGKPRPKLLAVVAETTSVDGFLDAFGEKGGETQTYLDAERGFQVALGDRWLGLQGLLYPSVWKNGKRAQTNYPELQGDMKGEGRRLGGLLVVDGEGVVQYSYLESVFGDHAPLEEVIAAVEKL